MSKFLTPIIGCVVAVFHAQITTSLGQGGLTPPVGTPQPTMKSLDQIEPRIPIDGTHTPGNGSNSFIIGTAGSYYLTGNITGASGQNGILISASNVSVDLRGYTVFGVSGSLTGITDGGASLTNIAVRNGTIRDWGGSGVDVSHSTHAAFVDLFIASNGTGTSGFGANIGGDSMMRDCQLRDNASDNVKTGDAANLFHCTSISSRNGNSFNIGSDSTAVQCVGDDNRHGLGFVVDTNCVLSKCSANNNFSGGIQANNGGGALSDCVADNNTSSGIVVSGGYTLTNCAAQGNGGPNGILAGTACTLTNCSATFNNATYGIKAGVGSSLINCSSWSNTSPNSSSYGIYVDSSTMIGCASYGNTTFNGAPNSSTGVGIYAGSSSTIKNCSAISNKGDGIQASQRCHITDCASHSNGNSTNGSGIVTDIRGVVQHCSASDNQKSGIIVLGGSVVSENTVEHNGVGGPAVGIDSSGGTGSRIEGNQARDNNATGIATTVGDIVIRNSVGGSVTTTPFSPGTGPNFAPTQSPSSATNPMANIIF